MKHQNLYALYIIKTADRGYSTGISKNVSHLQRFRQQHFSFYNKNKTNPQLVYCSKNFMCIECALRVERRLKKRPTSFKLKLINGQIKLNQLISFECTRNQC
ncbi:endonuclease [Hyposidra talaca nucleopolyhedrovirus]|uniref:Endonuclease n=1 Tax=Hyposidra talaca nucleopolyhedrovirus TaxID=1070315 RepID=A0A2Z4HI52_9ABAC|nr:endonuclease [Hyposidra talaca nucleopolyhedrovirus]AWW14454.1 endonuclease [Hyposidra talaca nucleopolyhedrovirus]